MNILKSKGNQKERKETLRGTDRPTKRVAMVSIFSALFWMSAAKIDGSTFVGGWQSYNPFIPILSKMSVIQPTSFNPSLLTISEAKKLDNGSSQAYVNYNGKKLRVQAPKLPVPMDAGDYQGNQKYKVQLSFRDKDSNPKVAAYYEMLEKIDEFVVNAAQSNSGKWFKKPGMARDIVLDKFTPSIKFAKDKEGNLKPYPPTQGVTLKKNHTTGAFDAELYDKNKEIIEDATPVQVLKRGSEITPILECTGVWITEKGFGLTWKLFQARVDVAAEGNQRGCAIQDDEEDGAAPVVVSKPKPVAKTAVAEDEEEDLLAAVKPAKAAAPAPAAAAADEVDEDEVHEAPAVPVAKKVIKKVIKKAA